MYSHALLKSFLAFELLVGEISFPEHSLKENVSQFFLSRYKIKKLEANRGEAVNHSNSSLAHSA